VAGARLMVLCDTNILIEFYKGTPTILQVLRRIEQQNIAVSAITKAELYFAFADFENNCNSK
jgi:predicted nucleic acid-binding protein